MSNQDIVHIGEALTWPKSGFILGLLLLALFLGNFLKPSNVESFGKPIDSLEVMVPKVIEGWTAIDLATIALVNPQQEETLNKVYSKMLSRTYENEEGYRIMLSISYGAKQVSDLAVHYPEVCYPAQGFNLLSDEDDWLSLGSKSIPIKKLRTVLNDNRFEPVTYWTTIGEYTTVSGFEKRLIELNYGFQGLIVDGLLFRVSSIDEDSKRGFSQQEKFIRAMLSEMQEEDRNKIVGTKLFADIISF